MNFIGNLKSTQSKKLLIIFEYSIMQSLRIVGAMEGVLFKFTSSSYFWKIGKIPNRAGPPVSARFWTAPRRPCAHCSDRGHRRFAITLSSHRCFTVAPGSRLL
jgi:hypothetical protein